MTDKDFLKAEEWFRRARIDREDATLLLKQGGHSDTITFLIQQWLEKYLKGFLLLHGWKLQKIHDLRALLNETKKYGYNFDQFAPLCRKLSQLYVESRYPLGEARSLSREEVLRISSQAEKLVKSLASKIDRSND